MGRYVPPELEGVVSHNHASGKSHALGSRARKLKSQGILTVRFEMPYAVWCGHCPKPTVIGQGVRFNAEKKKVGMYYSTPIWSFRMNHAVCGGTIEIRTDPKTTRYVVVEGGKQRDYGEDKIREGEEGREILTAEEREKRREDAFAVLEDRVEDKKVEVDGRKRIEELQDEMERHWDNPYEANRLARKGFRRERKERIREREKTEDIQSRLGLGVELVPETQEDARRAALIDFGDFREEDAMGRPLFRLADAKDGQKTIDKKKRVFDATRKRQLLEKQLRDNTRAVRNPFGVERAIHPISKPTRSLRHVKDAADTSPQHDDDNSTTASAQNIPPIPAATHSKQTAASLVAYDSE